jgi:hypothetical protein
MADLAIQREGEKTDVSTSANEDFRVPNGKRWTHPYKCLERGRCIWATANVTDIPPVRVKHEAYQIH